MNSSQEMRPQDIVILLKIALKRGGEWYMKDIATDLFISPSEVSMSLQRSVGAELIDDTKKMVIKQSLLEFLQYGIRYVFPQRPGSLVAGLPTAHSASPLNSLIKSQEHYVWPLLDGPMRGQAVQPLYPTVPQACLKDSSLHQVLALVDALRLGRARERNLAIEFLRKTI
jgi:hypothetical protein